MKKLCLLLLGSLGLVVLASAVNAANEPDRLWSHGNLLAWCTLPFDAKQRGPEERAAMLERLGFTMFAYDWRPQHIPTFEADIEALQKHHVRLQAWWFPGNAGDPTAKIILEALKRHDEHPQLWVAFSGDLAKTSEEQRQRIEQMARTIQALHELTKPYGCPVEIYKHNGWGGNEDNELAVIARLKELGIDDIGLVYNFSHAHDSDHDDTIGFTDLWKRIRSHVVAVNVAGMNATGGEVFPSQGVAELKLMRIIQNSGWQGPVGVIAEKGGDNEVTLADCLKGLDWLAAEIQSPGTAGPKPAFAPAPTASLIPASSNISATDLSHGSLTMVEGKFAKQRM